MRAVTSKDHLTLHEAAQAAALKGVDRGPDQREIRISHHLFDARNDPLGQLFHLRVGIPAQLQLDAIGVVRLLVQQRQST